MLSDLFTTLFTPCSPAIRRMGYLSEAIDMRGRARRHAAAWSSHLERSRMFLLACAERCTERRRVTILGSGLLLDVPLGELSSLFQEVVLMDVVCLPEARKQIRQFSNARFVEYDAAGIVLALHRNGEKGISGLPEPEPALSSATRGSGLVVSLNILSQLWVVPRAYASRKMRGLDEYAVDEWCSRIVAAHYAELRSLACDVCIIADHAYIKRDRNCRIISKDSSVRGLELPVPERSWSWDIAPYNDKAGVSKELIVGAWSLRGAS